MVPAGALPLPVRSRDDKERARLQDLVRRHFALQHPDIVAQVVRLLRPRVTSGGVSLDEVAAFLSLHPWSLLRRLKLRGTTFRRLLNETRYEVAGQLLRGTRLSVTADRARFGLCRYGRLHPRLPPLVGCSRPRTGGPDTRTSSPSLRLPLAGDDAGRRVFVRKDQADMPIEVISTTSRNFGRVTARTGGLIAGGIVRNGVNWLRITKR